MLGGISSESRSDRPGLAAYHPLNPNANRVFAARESILSKNFILIFRILAYKLNLRRQAEKKYLH